MIHTHANKAKRNWKLNEKRKHYIVHNYKDGFVLISMVNPPTYAPDLSLGACQRRDISHLHHRYSKLLKEGLLILSV